MPIPEESVELLKLLVSKLRVPEGRKFVHDALVNYGRKTSDLRRTRKEAIKSMFNVNQKDDGYRAIYDDCLEAHSDNAVFF